MIDILLFKRVKTKRIEQPRITDEIDMLLFKRVKTKRIEQPRITDEIVREMRFRDKLHTYATK